MWGWSLGDTGENDDESMVNRVVNYCDGCPSGVSGVTVSMVAFQAASVV